MLCWCYHYNFGAKWCLVWVTGAVLLRTTAVQQWKGKRKRAICNNKNKVTRDESVSVSFFCLGQWKMPVSELPQRASMRHTDSMLCLFVSLPIIAFFPFSSLQLFVLVTAGHYARKSTKHWPTQKKSLKFENEPNVSSKSDTRKDQWTNDRHIAVMCPPRKTSDGSRLEDYHTEETVCLHHHHWSLVCPSRSANWQSQRRQRRQEKRQILPLSTHCQLTFITRFLV